MDTSRPGEKMDNESNELVDRIKAAGKPPDFKNPVEEVNSVSNLIDDIILNRGERSSNEPTTAGKTTAILIARGFCWVSYASILKQPNKLTSPSIIPAYVPPRISPPKIQRGSIVIDLTQRYKSLLETPESLCDNNRDHSEEGRMKGSFFLTMSLI